MLCQPRDRANWDALTISTPEMQPNTLCCLQKLQPTGHKLPELLWALLFCRPLGMAGRDPPSLSVAPASAPAEPRQAQGAQGSGTRVYLTKALPQETQLPSEVPEPRPRCPLQPASCAQCPGAMSPLSGCQKDAGAGPHWVHEGGGDGRGERGWLSRQTHTHTHTHTHTRTHTLAGALRQYL